MFFAAATFLYDLAHLPDGAELAAIGQEYFLRFGFLAVFVAALIEAVFMVNIYFPGSFVIVLAVYLSDRSLGQLTEIATVSGLGFFLSGIGNYWLGRGGFYRALLKLGKANTIERMHAFMERRGAWATFLTAFHPNFLAICQVCHGIALEPFRRVMLLSALGLLFWVPFWTGVTAFAVTEIDITEGNPGWIIAAGFAALGVLKVGQEFFFPSRSRT